MRDVERCTVVFAVRDLRRCHDRSRDEGGFWRGDSRETFTIDPSSACPGLPLESRTRSYLTTITPGSDARFPRDTYSTATFSSGTFLGSLSSFPVGVSGNRVVFLFDEDGWPQFVEEISPHDYLYYSGRPEAMVAGASVSTLSTSFRSWISYCPMDGPMGAELQCRPRQGRQRAHCDSTIQLQLTRR
jgi:hypothetical protein